MEKKIINMLSKADSVDGQGVGSAYIEQVNLIKEGANDLFDVVVNSKRKDADIIHVHSINIRFFMRLKDKNSIKVVYCHFLPETLEGSISLGKFSFGLFKKYVINFYKRADYLVVVNPIFIDELVKLGIDKDHIVYIPNYVSKEHFHLIDIDQKRTVRHKFDIPQDKFVVLGCGQIQTRKGVIDFVDCALQNPDMLFIWCGGFSFGAITDGYKELKEVFENPPKNVRFLGIIPRTEMNNMFNMADCLFMPSYNELFPMAILEAVNSHTPIVLRDLDLYRDILFGHYLSGSDNEDFSTILRKLKNDKDYYKIGEENSKKISEYYSKEHVLEIWREFYSNILEHQNDEDKKVVCKA